MGDTIETVLFDVGETLLGPRESFGEVYSRVLAPHGIDRSPEEFDRAIRSSWLEMERLVRPGTDRYDAFPGGERGYWLQFVRGVLERVGLQGPRDGRAEEVLDSLRDAFKDVDAWTVYEDVVPTLRRLQEDGAILGVVSNWDSRLPSVLERLGLARFFRNVTVSSLVGAEKPDPAIFLSALEALQADPASTLHVGDLPEVDGAGAEAAGLRAVLVDRRGRLDPALGAFRDLRPIPEMVRRSRD
jgi:putative hydrolase of the HAD superfamily